jgi:hypothetical protein
LKRLPWSVTCLSPTQRQGEFLATQNPDGSLVFSAALKDERGLLSFLLVPPSANPLHTDNVTQYKTYPALGSPPTVMWKKSISGRELGLEGSAL